MSSGDRIAIVSVKHTGTNFMEAVVREAGFDTVAAHWSTYNKTRVSAIVSPIRNPLLTFRSWYSRNRFGGEFFKEWELFNQAWLDGKIAHVQPIDTEDRDEHLKKLSEVLGSTCVTDWKPVASGEHLDPPKTDISQVLNLEVVKHFYGDLNE